MSVSADKGLGVSHSEARVGTPDLVSMSSEVLIHGPEFKLDLTLLDQAFDQLYPETALRFRKRHDETPAAVEALITEALHRLARQVPWVASRVVPRPTPGVLPGILQVAWRVMRANVGLRLQPTEATTTYDVVPGALSLGVAHLAGTESLDTEQLPPSLWNPVPDAGCAMQLNFAPDNLVILTLMVHHALGDAHTIITLIKLLAQQVRDLQGDPEDLQPTHAIRPLPAALDRSRLMRRKPAKCDFIVPKVVDVGIYSLTEFLLLIYRAVVDLSLPRPLRRLAQVPNSSFATFKAALGHPPDSRLRVTYHDFVCGLLFRSVIAARRRCGLLPGRDDTVVTLSQAVNFRRRWGPAGASKEEPELGSGYMGNAVLFVRATVTLSELLNCEAEEGILAAAVAIRRAILEVHDDTIDSVLDLYASAPDPRLVRPMILPDVKSTAVMLTSWHGFPLHDIGWGPALSYRGGGQKSTAVWDGFSFVMPADPSGSCTISLSLNSNVMTELDKDIAWVTYSRWV